MVRISYDRIAQLTTAAPLVGHLQTARGLSVPLSCSGRWWICAFIRLYAVSFRRVRRRSDGHPKGREMCSRKGGPNVKRACGSGSERTWMGKQMFVEEGRLAASGEVRSGKSGRFFLFALGPLAANLLASVPGDGEGKGHSSCECD
jgi:hypothetical protein